MAKRIWAIVQLREGAVHPVARETISAACRLAEETGGGAVTALVAGSGVAAAAADVARMGVGRVLTADLPQLATYVPGPYTAALVEALQSEAPDYLFFPHTYQSVDYMARVAHAWSAGILSEIVAFESSEGELVWTRPILEGKLQAKVKIRGDGPMVISVQAGAFPPAERAETSCTIEELSPIPAGEPEREILGFEDVGGDTVDLSAAETIVAVGRGLGGPEKMAIIEDLARALRAEIGASRPVIDNGWLPRDRQIGSSGQTVSPKLYVAIGISGAIQHLVGMKGAGCTVAINKDAGAPIFTVADYGIVGDMFEIVPALTAALGETSADA